MEEVQKKLEIVNKLRFGVIELQGISPHPAGFDLLWCLLDLLLLDLSGCAGNLR